MLYKIFSANINSLCANICPESVAVAVSGGVDSIALLLLISKWAESNNVKLTVLTINHNLRIEAKSETNYVKELSIKLGHDCFILSWNHQNNFANLQARAREGRYQLMTDLCQQLNILTLVTAHHQDDYIENFCIRQQRKSGILGLSSSNINFYNNIRVLRPLFNISKQQLIDYLVRNNVKWFEDKSNESDKYQRNRIRKNLSIIERQLIQEQQLEINEQAKKLQFELVSAIAESAAISQHSFAVVDLSNFASSSSEVKLQLLNYIFTIIGGNQTIPRFESTNLILSLISQNQDFTKTLHGCLLEKRQQKLFVYRCFGKKLPKQVELQAGCIWDNRFRFDFAENFERSLAKSKCYITNLTLNDYIEIKNHPQLKKLKNLPISNYKAILFALPVIKTLEKIVALPHISYYNNATLAGKLNFSYQPSFMSRFTHFC